MKKINVKGTIIPNDYKPIYDYFKWDATCPRDISTALQDCSGEEITVEINSPGGHVFAGSEIYTALMDYTGNVVVKILGVAASAASMVAMAGSRVLISPAAQIMIHNVSSWAAGDYRVMQHSAEELEIANESLAEAYCLKTGLPQAEILKMMNNETWFAARRAKELGFADEIMFEKNAELTAGAQTALVMPPEVMTKIQNLIGENKELAKQLEYERLNKLKRSDV